MSRISIKITGETENDPITEINCGRTSPKLGGNINISMFPELTGFTCEYNDIQNISNLALNPNLQRVEIDGNKLTAINSGSGLSSNLQLQYFDCSDNQLTGNIFDLSLNNNLTYFNCSGNKFTGFTSGNQIPYTLSTFNANNNNLYQTSVDSILDAFIKNNRDSSYGSFDLNLNGTNRHPSLSDNNVLIFSSGSGFLRSGTTLVTANVSGHGFSNGSIISISGITNATQLNGTYIVTGVSTNQFQYNTTGAGFATGSGTAVIRWTNSTTDGFRKYQILTLPTGQAILDPINGDIQGRGLNVQINSFFEPIKLGNSISGTSLLEYFGKDVAINKSGNIVAVIGQSALASTMYETSLGYYRAEINKWNGSSWIRLGQVLYGENYQDFGLCISINDAGDIIAIGAAYDLPNIYPTTKARILQYNGSSWVEMGDGILGVTYSNYSNDQIQLSLNSSGNRIVIGNAYENNDSSGSVRVFEWNGSSWIQLGSTIRGEAYNDQLGSGVDINDAGDVIIIGAANALGFNRGKAYIYGWNGIEWTQIGQSLFGEGEYDRLVNNVSINSIGNRVAISNPFFDYGNGTARIYEYNGSSWVQLGQSLYGDDNYFGFDISLNDIGDRILVSQLGYSMRGFLYTYEFNGILWEKLTVKIPIGSANSVQGGRSIDINKLGNTAIIGAPYEVNGTGTASMYQLPSYPL
jgi:hypothetical protein